MVRITSSQISPRPRWDARPASSSRYARLLATATVDPATPSPSECKTNESYEPTPLQHKTLGRITEEDDESSWQGLGAPCSNLYLLSLHYSHSLAVAFPHSISTSGTRTPPDHAQPQVLRSVDRIYLKHFHLFCSVRATTTKQSLVAASSHSPYCVLSPSRTNSDLIDLIAHFAPL